MGTVGLAFGSPTSGAGFNVSSTVAEIIGNLQKVETPWQSQLTSLESQDTVISSLGTLFSNLSTDMSQLTDFNGVLAQKEGSSSDTNVLELTSATSSAVAGTHTVVVNNLAADLERLHGGDRQQLGYAVRLDHAPGGQRHGADHHPRFLRQHALRPGFGHQLLGRGHHRQRAHRCDAARG